MSRRRLHPSHNSTLIRLICIGRHKADVAFSFYLGGRRSFSFGSFKMASDGTASGPTCLSFVCHFSLPWPGGACSFRCRPMFYVGIRCRGVGWCVGTGSAGCPPDGIPEKMREPTSGWTTCRCKSIRLQRAAETCRNCRSSTAAGCRCLARQTWPPSAENNKWAAGSGQMETPAATRRCTARSAGPKSLFHSGDKSQVAAD